MKRTTFVATGDSFITRHIGENGYEGYVMWGLKSGPLGLLKKDENAQRVVS